MSIRLLSLCLVGLLLPLPASAQNQNSKAALEEAIRRYRPQLPKEAHHYGAAIQGLVRQDPTRGAALIRESVSLAKPGDNMDYYLIRAPLDELARIDFARAAELALERPARLLPLLQEPYNQLIQRDIAKAEHWGREFLRRAPREGAALVVGMARARAQPYQFNEKDRAARASEFERLMALLPAGPSRAALWLENGLARVYHTPDAGFAALRKALDEDPGLRPQLDLGLYRAGATAAVYGKPTTGDWERLAARFRSVGWEAGVAGLIRRLVWSDPAVALRIARAIDDPAMRALALSELVAQETGERAEPHAPAAAREVALLLPEVRRPALLGFLAYRLGTWEEQHDQKPRAAEHFRLAFDAVQNLQGLNAGIFGAPNDSTTALDIQGPLLARLAAYRPDEALQLALSRRKQVGQWFSHVVVRAAGRVPERKAEQWLRAYIPKAELAQARWDYLACVADVDPARVAGLVARLPASRPKDVALGVAVVRLGEKDPARAVETARFIRSSNGKSASLLAGTWSARIHGPAVMLRLAREIPLPLIRADAMALVAQAYLNPHHPKKQTEAGLLEARRVTAEMPNESPKWKVMAEIAEALSRKNPEDAFGYARQIGRYTERVAEERRALLGLVPMRLERALELARQEESEEGRADLTAAVAEKLAQSDPARAIQFAEGVEHRPTREQILAGAIRSLLTRDLDRALALAPRIVGRLATEAVYPQLWQNALRQRKTPAQVWPLYRWVSRNAFNAGWNWRMDPPLDSDGRNAYAEIVRRTAAWLKPVPAREWQDALRPHVQGPADGRIDAGFLTAVAVELAAQDPAAAQALVESAGLGETGWSGLVEPLAKKDLAAADRAAQQIASPAGRLGASLTMRRAALEQGVPDAPYTAAALREASRVAAQIAVEKDTSARPARYLELARKLQREGLDAASYRVLTRQSARKLRDPLQRAVVLRGLEQLERGGK